MNEKSETLIQFINNEISTVPILLNNKLSYKNIKFRPRNEFYELKNHINDFLNGDILNRYFILPGLRAVGKTTLMYQIYEYLLKEKNIPQNQILYLSCDRLNNRFDFKIIDVVESFLEYHHNSNLHTIDKKIFLLIDESQNDSNWAMSGKNIYDLSNNIFMIFSRSSALDLEFNADPAVRLLKRYILPLNYSHYLKLKYDFDTTEISNELYNVLFTGNVENAIEHERKIIPQLYNIPEYFPNNFDNFIQYGGFPLSFFQKDDDIVSERLIESIERVVSIDIPRMEKISNANLVNAQRLLNFLALQKPGEISQNNISNYLDCSSTTVKNILEILENTHLIFHLEPYGSASTRSKKSWRYYFATSSLRNILNNDLDDNVQNLNAYNGVLLENFVASTLYGLKLNKKKTFNMFYDLKKKKKNVDFVIQSRFGKPVPIEVGIGKKDKNQIFTAIRRYNADYGIVISNNYQFIKKEDNVIFIPPNTFSLI